MVFDEISRDVLVSAEISMRRGIEWECRVDFGIVLFAADRAAILNVTNIPV